MLGDVACNITVIKTKRAEKFCVLNFSALFFCAYD